MHDLLLTKNGVAAPESHPLRLAVTRHKARLHAELTKARVKRGFASIRDLGSYVNNSLSLDLEDGDGKTNVTHSGGSSKKWSHPRWVRINTLRTSLDEQLCTTFAGYEKTDTINRLFEERSKATVGRLLHIDKHIPNLLALPPAINLSKVAAYQNGSIILQDKASCFPAYILNPGPEDGDIIDACAAPGNKTTHVAALLQSYAGSKLKAKVWACERDKERSVSLKMMTDMAGAENIVNIKAEQDFLKINPERPHWDTIGSLLVDPSCSGSGIVGRDKKLNVVLPKKQVGVSDKPKSLKRKRKIKSGPTYITEDAEEILFTTEDDSTKLSARLDALSTIQLKLLLHAFHFSNARKVVYSTCSVYSQENEHVVIKALDSPIAMQRKWRILRRDEQVSGARAWPIRGDRNACQSLSFIDGIHELPIIAESCIRCEKETAEGTQGFFVAAFVRDEIQIGLNVEAYDPLFAKENSIAKADECKPQGEDSESDSEWEGFSDDE